MYLCSTVDQNTSSSSSSIQSVSERAKQYMYICVCCCCLFVCLTVLYTPLVFYSTQQQTFPSRAVSKKCFEINSVEYSSNKFFGVRERWTSTFVGHTRDKCQEKKKETQKHLRPRKIYLVYIYIYIYTKQAGWVGKRPGNRPAEAGKTWKKRGWHT